MNHTPTESGETKNKSGTDGNFKESRFTIRVKLLLITTLILFIALGGMSFTATSLFKERIEILIREYNLSLARLTGGQIEKELRGIAFKTRLMAAAIESTPAPQRAERANFYFQENDDYLFLGIAEYDEKGPRYTTSLYNSKRIRLGQPGGKRLQNLHEKFGKRFQDAAGGRILVFNLSPAAGLPLMGVSLPFHSSDQRRFIIAFLRPDKMLKAFRTRAQTGIFDLFIVDQNGTIVAHTDEKLALSGPNRRNEPIVSTLLKSRNPNGSRRYKYKGVVYLGAYQSLDFAGLGIISRVEEGRAFAAAFAIQKRNIILTVIALTLSFLVIFFFSKSLTIPIARLAQAVRQVEKGDFRPAIRPSSGDEVGLLTSSFVSMARGLEEREALRGEMEAARKIQMAILPSAVSAGSYRIAASMKPADDVGGDYYDIIETSGGEIWAAIGDVSGHGLDSGLIMVMVQTALSQITEDYPRAAPSELLKSVNRVIRRNLARMDVFRYMTLTLIRLTDNEIIYAGKHESIMIYRAARNAIEITPTAGTWIGIADDISKSVPDNRLDIGPGDIVLLYTDGITEAMTADNELFGEQRLLDVFQRNTGRPLEEIRDIIMQEVFSYQNEQLDDISILLLKKNDSRIP